MTLSIIEVDGRRTIENHWANPLLEPISNRDHLFLLIPGIVEISSVTSGLVESYTVVGRCVDSNEGAGEFAIFFFTSL